MAKPKKTLYTVKDCGGCEELKKKLAKEIKSGEVELVHCNPEGTEEEKQNCIIALTKHEFNSFPLLIDKQIGETIE